jgi:2-hydroxychromene-2-carboxylate isomerase
MLKNGTAVAQFVATNQKICTGQNLAAILNTAGLTDREFKAWRRDQQASRKSLKDS